MPHRGLRRQQADADEPGPGDGRGEIEVDLAVPKYEGEEIEIGFNPQFITDALKIVDEPQIVVELKAPNRPGVFRSGSDFTYVVMPVNLQ